MNTMLERLGVPSARNARYFAPGDSFRSITPRRSVGNGCKDGKGVCQFEWPNGVKSLGSSNLLMNRG
jgi:hypothetical protein